MEHIFWIIVALVLYIYFGYPLLLLLLSKLRPASPVQKADITPTVSLIIAAYNEEKVISQKIENCLALDYPREKLEIIVASDGSTDGTNEIVGEYQDKGIKLVALPTNRGKSAAQNAAVKTSTGDVIVFSDATSMFQVDALCKLVAPFVNQYIGCVSGRYYYQNTDESAASSGEGLYWEYEVAIRTAESQWGNFALASGSIMGIRRELFNKIDANMSEDLILPIEVVLKGLKVIYVLDAISSETVARTNQALFKTKVRIITKDLRGLLSRSAILNPFRYPKYSWGLISHKLLRWLIPFFLIAVLVLNVLLISQLFYMILLGVQAAFYSLAIVGLLWKKKSKPPLPMSVSLAFCVVNAASLVGVLSFLIGKRAGRWEPIR